MAVTGFRPPLHVVEQFVTNDLVSDNNVGQFGWQIQDIGNATTVAYLTGEAGTSSADGTCNGGIRLTTNTTADGDGIALNSFTDGLTLNNKGGYFKFRFRYPDITGNQLAGNDFRIGINDSVTATAPTKGLTVFSDAGVLALHADSAANGDVSASAGQLGPSPTLTSGTTAILGTWHDVEVQWSGDNGDTNPGPDTAVMYVDGLLAAELRGSVLIDSSETVELKIVHYQNSGSGATLELDLDFFEFYQNG